MTERVPARTLAAVMSSSDALGARRLTSLLLQLTRELELAERAGIASKPVTLHDVVVEDAGSKGERARLVPVPEEPAPAEDGRAQLQRLGALVDQLIAEKPLFLEEAVWMPPGGGDDRTRRRRADADVLRALARALSLIAQRCQGGPGAYTTYGALALDLHKLSVLTERIIARRRAPAPVVSVAHPKPRHVAGAPLPKVIVDAERAPEEAQPTYGQSCRRVSASSVSSGGR